MDTISLIVTATLIFLLAMFMLWLSLEQHRLRQDNQFLLEQLESMRNDVAGLCSAAVKVDEAMFAHTGQIAELFDKLKDYENQKSEALPYHLVIQKIRAGAGAEELIKECGLGREEVALLIKLHGANDA